MGVECAQVASVNSCTLAPKKKCIVSLTPHRYLVRGKGLLTFILFCGTTNKPSVRTLDHIWITPLIYRSSYAWEYVFCVRTPVTL